MNICLYILIFTKNILKFEIALQYFIEIIILLS